MSLLSKLQLVFAAALVVLSLQIFLISSDAAARAGPSLSSRLVADNTTQCWESLVELRSCSGEVVLFFLNGEAYLGPSCCRAIRVIQHTCWATDAMLAALGFTAQEGDILKGYCGAPSAPSADGSFVPPTPSDIPGVHSKAMTTTTGH